MRYAPVAGWMGAAAMMLVPSIALAQAEPESSVIRANEITRALRGKVCTSRVGATFAFAKDGHYAYDGLWTDHGHYAVHDGAVTILLDSGLEKTSPFRGGEESFTWRKLPSHVHELVHPEAVFSTIHCPQLSHTGEQDPR